MDAILLTVTGIALALAAVMGVLLKRMLSEGRRRSEARVALLSDLAADPGRAAPYAEIDAFPPEDMRPRPEPATRPSRMLGFDDIELRPSVEDVRGVHDLFHEQEEPSPWPRRFAVVGGLAAVLALVVFGWSNFAGRLTTAVPSAQVSEVVVDTPLELLSLRHAQEDGTLTITGLVQNPRAGRPLSAVKATLFVFGPGGSFITSGRAPLDFTSLGAGDESPFVIRVPVTGTVTRYRVGFRGDDDRVLAHVDRRSPEAIAQK